MLCRAHQAGTKFTLLLAHPVSEHKVLKAQGLLLEPLESYRFTVVRQGIEERVKSRSKRQAITLTQNWLNWIAFSRDCMTQAGNCLGGNGRGKFELATLHHSRPKQTQQSTLFAPSLSSISSVCLLGCVGSLVVARLCLLPLTHIH
jgi:hypothetical protein